MKSLFQSLMVSACLLASLDQSLADTLVKEEKLLLPVQINSNVEQLETLIVKPNDGEKFPLVLIVNGSATGSPAEEHPEWLVAIAHDFAHRGYIAASIVWPGYGLSTGTFMKNGGDCTKPTVSRFLDTHAGDLQAALNALHARPDVDPSVTLGMGFSIGGASMLDLAARPNRPLTAVINISGGVYHYDVLGTPAADCSLYQDDLVRSFTNFGRDNSTPTLWIYAANDPFFEPDLVQRMLAGYRSEGGQVDFVGLPPFQKDGHTLFKNEASVLTEPKIDDFLRRIHLPAMDEDELAPLLSSLPADSRASVKLYMKNVSEKAIAMADNISTVYWYYGAPTIEKARQQALADCRNERGPTCHIVAENLHLVDGWRDKMSEANR